MNFIIGEKLKTLRTRKGISEDRLAQYLKVGCKDVIKWESGETTPPLELIPYLADYFEVTTDELLCMDRFDHQDRIREYLERFQDFVASDKLREATETMREGLIHFPSNYRFKCMLMYSLYLSCDRPAAIKHYTGEILTLYEEILNGCTEDAIRLEAKRLLCLHYCKNLNDRERAREIAMTLPGRNSSREDMLPIITEGESKLRVLQENISSYTRLLGSALLDYTECEPTFAVREKLAAYELYLTVIRSVYSSGDAWFAYPDMISTDRKLAVLYMGAGETDIALDRLEDAARLARIFDSMPKTSAYKTAYVNRLKYVKPSSDTDKQSLSEKLLADISCHQAFEPIRYHSRIKNICDILLGK